MNKTYITSAVRTAVGSLGKSLKNVKAEDLGSAVITESIIRSKINKNDIDEVIFGQVLTEALDKIRRDKLLLKQVFRKKNQHL